MLGEQENIMLQSLSLLLASHRESLSCRINSRRSLSVEKLNLPTSYEPCLVPTIPKPNELLSAEWTQSKPQEYIQLLHELTEAWREFSSRRQNPPSPAPSSCNMNMELASQELGPASPFSTDSNQRCALSPDSQNTSEEQNERGRSKRYRKARAYFQKPHLDVLEGFYKKQSYLSTQDRELLAQTLGLSEDRVRTWFQNRRMREKRRPRLDSFSMKLTSSRLTKTN